MRALSFLLAALLGIALALIAPALAGPAHSIPGPAVEATASVAEMEMPVERSDATAAAEVDEELDASLMVDLGLDAFPSGDAA